MATLDIRYMCRYPEGIKFLHTTYRKRSHNGTLGESIYPKFSQCSRLCPVECLSTYLEKTKQLRPSSDSMQQPLFLALKKPHRPVSSATLSRSLKEVIHLAGIKEDIFKGHSVRGASTSAVKRAGLSIGTILSMADWTNTSTFNMCYYKPSLQTFCYLGQQYCPHLRLIKLIIWFLYLSCSLHIPCFAIYH